MYIEIIESPDKNKGDLLSFYHLQEIPKEKEHVTYELLRKMDSFGWEHRPLIYSHDKQGCIIAATWVVSHGTGTDILELLVTYLKEAQIHYIIGTPKL